MLLKISLICLGLILLTLIIFFFPSCGQPIPSKSHRFANSAPIEEFEVPTETLTLPADNRKEIKESIRKAAILPFTFFDQHHFFYVTKDQENVYVTMDYQADLEQSDSAEAQKRKPYRGISAFDLKTKQLKWHIPYLDPKACTFSIDTNTMRLSEPALLDNSLIIFKRTYTNKLDNCYNIIDKKTGKILYMEGMQGGIFDIEYFKYFVRYEYKKNISLLNPHNGKVVWTYLLGKDFQGDGTNRIKLLSDRICYYDYQKKDHFGFDFIEISTGKIVKHLEFEKKSFKQTFLKPLALQGNILFFAVYYCSNTGFEVRPGECEYCFIMFDTQTNQVLKRTEYKK